MKKLLLLAVAVFIAGGIVVAVSGLADFSGSSASAPVQVADHDSGGAGTLDMDNCIAYVGKHYCLPEPVNKCRTVFEAMHWNKGTDCCAHDAGTLYFKLGAGEYARMSKCAEGYDPWTGCYWELYCTSEYLLDDDTEVLYWVYDDADPDDCKNSGSLYIDCQ